MLFNETASVRSEISGGVDRADGPGLPLEEAVTHNLGSAEVFAEARCTLGFGAICDTDMCPLFRMSADEPSGIAFGVPETDGWMEGKHTRLAAARANGL